MPRRTRKDYPGAWWHVMNRSVDLLEIFRNRPERRLFLRLLAAMVRRGWLQIHAYSLMPNHFHLLVRSPCGKLSQALHWIEYRFARRFNHVRGRPGAVFGGRFHGKLIHCLTYRRAAFHYIHRNAEAAGLLDSPHLYEDSRSWYASERRGRPWLTRAFGCRVRAGQDELPRDLVERWFADPAQDSRATDLLRRGSVSVVRGWLRREGSGSGKLTRPRSLVRPQTLRGVIRQMRRDVPDFVLRSRRGRGDVWDLLTVGLHRAVCGMSVTEVVEATGVPRTTVGRRLHAHQDALLGDDRYAALVASVVVACMKQDYAVAS